MDVILELYHLIRKLTSRRDPATRMILDADNLSTKLLKGYFSGAYQNDEAAAKGLYPDTPQGRKAFRQLKYILINKLTSLLFFLNLNPGKYSQYAINLYKAKRELFAAETMETFQAYTSLKFLVSRTIKTAEEFHLTDVQLRCNELMRNLYSRIGTREEFVRYRDRVEELEIVLQAERHALNVSTDMVNLMATQMMPPIREVNQLKSGLERVKNDLAQYGTRTLQYHYMWSAGDIYRYLGEFTRAQESYREYLNFLDAHPQFDFPAQRVLVNHFMARCHLFAGELSDAADRTRKAIENEEVGTGNWFAVTEVQLLIYLHQREYIKASELFIRGLKVKGFRDAELRQEVWSIFESYLRLFVKDGAILPAKTTVRGQSFQLNFTIEELSNTRKDKVGMYVAILIFQVVHYLQERHFELTESRVKALRNVLYRYLRPEDENGQFSRTDTLVSMLAMLVNYEFDYETVERKSRSLYEHLVNSKYKALQDGGGLSLEEIVPYDHIWSLVLQELQAIKHEGVLVRPL